MPPLPVQENRPPPLLRIGCLTLAFSLFAHIGLATAQAVRPETARGYCFAHAAHTYGVNQQVLLAIAWRESHLQPWKVHHNSDGSTDYGVMQINSRNLPFLGLTQRSALALCPNILAGARLYRRAIQRYGNTWAAVGAYHSTTPMLRQRYARDVQQSFALISRFDAWRSSLRQFFCRVLSHIC